MSLAAKKFLLVTALALGLSGPTLGGPKDSDPACDFSSFRPVIIHDWLGERSVVKRAKPEYPEAARSARAEGHVQVKILIDPDGNVAEACAAVGHPLLREPSRQAALRWKFKRNFGFAQRPGHRYMQHWIVFTFEFDERVG